MVNRLRKIMLSAAVVSACTAAHIVWGGENAAIDVQPNPQTVHPLNRKAVQHIVEQKPHHALQSGGGNKNAPVAAANIRPQPVKPVKQAQTLQGNTAIRMIQTGSLLTEPVNNDPVKINLQQSAPAKTEKTEKTEDTEAADGFGLDIGNGLPLPTPDSILIAPQDRPTGFHVGVDYRLDQKWALTGMAGVMTTGGIVTTPVKPSVNQVGVRASYRF